MDKTKKLYTVKEASEQLRLSVYTLRMWIHSNRLPVIRLVRRVMNKKSTIENLINYGSEKVLNKNPLSLFF
jgi:excisionase family DNA binding protein